MADGAQIHFGFPVPHPGLLDDDELIVDFFAGGGGASEALKDGLGREPDIAANHDEWALGLHAANHRMTRHLRADVFEIDPVAMLGPYRFGWFHASPDCTHHSQARGGQPRSEIRRSLSWVIVKVIGKTRKAGKAPRYFTMENVWQILQWGPLIARRDPTTGRVVKLDGTIAAKGERVPVQNQWLIPDKRHAGRTWRRFASIIRGFGYSFERHKLAAHRYGAGTSRERLFAAGRRDGIAVPEPKPTHGPGLQPFVVAADHIDFTDRGQSIFNRPRPLADRTMRKIALGIQKQVIGNADPYFIIEHANASREAVYSVREPLRTICANVKGGHFALVEAELADAVEANEIAARRVAAFLLPYYGNGQAVSITEPLDTITTHDRFALVTVEIAGEKKYIVDVRMRMLRQREQFNLQGFPPDYIIDRTADFRPITNVRAQRMVGNSVSKHPLVALIREAVRPGAELLEAA